MSDLASWVQSWTDRPLIDKTGNQGTLYHMETETVATDGARVIGPRTRNQAGWSRFA